MTSRDNPAVSVKRIIDNRCWELLQKESANHLRFSNIPQGGHTHRQTHIHTPNNSFYSNENAMIDDTIWMHLLHTSKEAHAE